MADTFDKLMDVIIYENAVSELSADDAFDNLMLVIKYEVAIARMNRREEQWLIMVGTQILKEMTEEIYDNNVGD